jgi:hypothetical protein
MLFIRSNKVSDIMKTKRCELVVRNSYTPSPLKYALTKKPVGSGTTM